MPVDSNFSEQPVHPTSFTATTPQVISSESDPQIFTPQNHLTTAELKEDGTNWVKILLLIAVLLLLLDAGVFGYNLWRGVENPDLLAPLKTLLNR